MTIWRMPTACWVPKSTNTHSEYIIIIAIPLRQRLQESIPMLRHTYIACLVRLLFRNPKNKVQIYLLVEMGVKMDF